MKTENRRVVSFHCEYEQNVGNDIQGLLLLLNNWPQVRSGKWTHFQTSVLSATGSWNKIPGPKMLYIILRISWVESSKPSIRVMGSYGAREEVGSREEALKHGII